jgi:hypothetical protein
MHAGTPFAKKGGSELSLPRMDVPINLLQWEVFLPEQYKLKDFGGDVLAANLVPTTFESDKEVAEYGAAIAAPRGTGGGIGSGRAGGVVGGIFNNSGANGVMLPGQLGGVVTDPSGAVAPNAHVTVTNTDTGFSSSTVTDSSGRWLISNFPAGRVHATVETRGFKTEARDMAYDSNQPLNYSTTLQLGAASEQVEVSAEAPTANEDSRLSTSINGRNYAQLQQLESNAKRQEQNAASANVMNLQRRVAGVLPVAIEVPRTGTSFQFVRPLVLDEETKVTFSYKTK